MTTTTDFAKYLSRYLSEYLPHERNRYLPTGMLLYNSLTT